MTLSSCSTTTAPRSEHAFSRKRDCPIPQQRNTGSWQAPRPRERPASRLAPSVCWAGITQQTGPGGRDGSLLERGVAFSEHMPSCWGKPSSVLSLSASKRTRRHQGAQAWPPWWVQWTHGRTRCLSYYFWQEDNLGVWNFVLRARSNVFPNLMYGVIRGNYFAKTSSYSRM